MDAQISAATWMLLTVPLLGVVLLSALSLFRKQPVKAAAAPQAPEAPGIEGAP